jgi:uncharacterized protein (TIGR01777 family)
MKILVTGSHGLVGSALAKVLKRDGHQVFALVRRPPRSDSEFEWYPDDGELPLGQLEGLEAVVHLAGESIAQGRWTAEKKQRIRDSRVMGTELLSKSLAQLNQPPKILINASAIGYYGDRGDEILTEESTPGTDFLAQVCVDWERATEPAVAQGVRVVNLRIGIILSSDGGALRKMLTPFKLGLGGRLGNGKQYMSWVVLDDVIATIKLALANDATRGPINLVAPNPVTNAEFTKTLGKALSRPTLLPTPAFAVKLAFGDMADALLLSSQRVEPARLKGLEYQFQYATLDQALRYVLTKKAQHGRH